MSLTNSHTKMKLMMSTNAVKNNPTTGTLANKTIELVKTVSRYPNTSAIVMNIQIIHMKM